MGVEVKGAEVKEMYILLTGLEEKARKLQRMLEPPRCGLESARPR